MKRKNTSREHPTQNSSCIANTKTQHEWISIIQIIINPIRDCGKWIDGSKGVLFQITLMKMLTSLKWREWHAILGKTHASGSLNQSPCQSHHGAIPWWHGLHDTKCQVGFNSLWGKWWRVASEWRCQPKSNPSLRLLLSCKMGPKGLGEEPWTDWEIYNGSRPSHLGVKWNDLK